jgi:hypothetical protein
MSEYFRVLKRIERNEPEIDVPGSDRPDAAQRHDQAPPASHALRRPVTAVPAANLTRSDTAAAFATLFDNIRALAGESPVRHLVFAGVSAAESVRNVTTGLAAHIERRGLRVLMAELTNWSGRPILRSRNAGTTAHANGEGDPMPLDLGGTAAHVELADWLQGAECMADFIVIEGRPLAESIDSALLARACDGLVIVAQTEVTLRDALQVAAERAHAVGCRTLGIVLNGTRDHLPPWVRRFVGAHRPTLAGRGR